MTRQEAIEELNQLKHNLLAECKADIAVDMAIQALSKDENVKGEWIELRNGVKRCSVCGFTSNHLLTDNFCPNCGADMRVKKCVDGKD